MLVVAFTGAVMMSAAAQTEQTPQAGSAPGAVLKATTRLIQVDVIAQDGHGGAITDLTPEDFVILEDGKEQKLTTVTFQKSDGTKVQVQALPPNTFTNKPSFSARSTLNVVLMDALNTNIADQTNARKQMIKFIQKMPADEPIAVYALGNKLSLIQDFTTDPKILQQAIENVNASHALVNKGTAEEQLPQGYFDQISGNISGVSPGVPLGQEAGMGGGPGNNTQAQIDLMMFQQEVINLQDDLRAQYTTDCLRALARRLTGFIGRKNLIWLSASFPVAVSPDVALGANAFSGTRSRADEIAKAANALIDANIAIYPIDIRGLLGNTNAANNGLDSLGRRGSSGPAIVDALRQQANDISFAQDSSKDLAERTGGKAFYNTNDLDAAVQNSVMDGSSYYLISYYPSNKNWNGKFRKITVKVNRSGAKVRNRMGYYATDSAIYQKVEAKAKEADFKKALDANMPLSTGLIFQVNVASVTSNKVAIRYNVEGRSIGFDAEPDGLNHAEIECAAWIYSAKGKPLDFQTDFMQASVKAEAISGIVQQGFPCEQSLTLPKGEYLMRLGVRDTHTGLFGTANARLTMP